MKAGNTKFFRVITAIWLCLSGIAMSVERHVPSQYSTIQAAIDDCNDGDTVIVAPGTYTGDGNRDIDFKGKAITVRGETGDPNDCVINCEGDVNEPHRGFNFLSGEDENSVLEAITITNGYGPKDTIFPGILYSVGGAVYCSLSSPIVKDCTFRDNWSEFGGGIFNDFLSSPIVEGCIFSNNSAVGSVSGGGVGGGMVNNRYSSPTVTNCTFSGNKVKQGDGGGMLNWDNSSPTVANCTFRRNSASRGGGIANFYSSSPTLEDCTFTGNEAENLGGGMYNVDNSNPTVEDCTFNGNSAVSGGGMYNDESSPIVEVCIFNGNSVTNRGGGMCNENFIGPTVKDCTFSNNTATFGGGMYNRNNSSPTVENCFFISNSADMGGGMFNREGSPTPDKCTFTQNSADDGGGMNNYSSNLTMTDCTFSGNTALSGGGGMYNYESSPTVENCIFNDNLAAAGGGIYNFYSSIPTITNSIFSGNLANAGGGMCNWYSSNPTLTNCTFSDNIAFKGGGIHNSDSNPMLTNCILWADMPSEIYGGTPIVTYSNVQGGWSGAGNINVEPQFVDANSGDYHLLPDSPCINAGDPASDFGLEPEPDGGRINMGAYGNTPEATCKGGLVLQSYNLVSKTRVGRTVFEYIYTMTLNNNSTEAVSNVIVELLDAPDNVTILDPDVSFAYIEAGESAISDDTFSIVVDRSVTVDATIISWRATFDTSGGGGAGQTIFTTRIDLETNTSDILADGEIDFEDLAVLAEQWLGQPGDTSADIAPQPDGDGVVNFLDFAELAENWQN